MLINTAKLLHHRGKDIPQTKRYRFIHHGTLISFSWLPIDQTQSAGEKFKRKSKVLTKSNNFTVSKQIFNLQRS